jgi:integrase
LILGDISGNITAVTPANLKLFRRHESTCTGDGKTIDPQTGKPRPYKKEFRIYEEDAIKRKRRRSVVDCSCTIYAEGTVYKKGVKLYVRPKSTATRKWEDARKVRENWIAWGGAQAPVEHVNPADELVTVPNAVQKFLTTKKNQPGVGDERLADVKRLVELRLIPFAESKRITFIQEMDNADVWAVFRDSWKNLNPLHNRKPKPGEAVPDTALGQNTVSKHVGTLREFIRFCVSREWLADNWASAEHGMKVSKVIEPKEPFSHQELEYIYKATESKTDGHGFKVKRTGQQNAWEVLVFIWTLRYTGLRISDVVQLATRQLDPFDAYGYSHALWCHPMKTKEHREVNFVHIPIQAANLPGHPNLVKALQGLPVKQGRYFFLGGEGTLRTNISSWRSRVNDVFRLAETIMERDGLPIRNGTHFAEHPHPHKFRHTFAATLLQVGVPLRIVAQYLGDTEETVRKHYAKFCKAEQLEAAAVLAEGMRKLTQVQTAEQRGSLHVVR